MRTGELTKIYAVPPSTKIGKGRGVLDFALTYAEAVEMRELYRKAGWAAYIIGSPQY